MSDQELKDLVASLAIAHKEIAAEQKENARLLNQFGLEIRQANVRTEAEQKENARQFNLSNQQLIERMAASRAEVDKQIKQTQKQLGELGNKWGTFAEAAAIGLKYYDKTYDFCFDTSVAPQKYVLIVEKYDPSVTATQLINFADKF